MSRFVLPAAAALVVALPAAAPAQVPVTVASGVGSFNSYGPAYPYGSFGYAGNVGAFGGFVPYGGGGFNGIQSTFAPRFDGGASGSFSFGGFYTPYAYLPGYGYGAPYGLGSVPAAYASPYPGVLTYPVPVPVTPAAAAAVAPSPGSGLVASGNQSAVLTIEFPAPADVWVNGKEDTGRPTPVRELTSPDLPPGAKFTFDVRGEWAAGGKTYEYTRTVTLGSGERARITVSAGTQIAAPTRRDTRLPKAIEKIEPAK